MENRKSKIIKTVLSVICALLCFWIEYLYHRIGVQRGMIITLIVALMFIWIMPLENKKTFWGGMAVFVVICGLAIIEL